MNFVLDTNAVSDLVAEHPVATARLAAVAATDTVLLSVVTRGELLFGLERLPAGRRTDNLRIKLAGILGALAFAPVTPAVAEQYALTKAACERAGGRVNDNNLWIAATVLTLNATLVTRDKDFGLVAGLTIEDWTV